MCNTLRFICHYVDVVKSDVTSLAHPQQCGAFYKVHCSVATHLISDEFCSYHVIPNVLQNVLDKEL